MTGIARVEHAETTTQSLSLAKEPRRWHRRQQSGIRGNHILSKVAMALKQPNQLDIIEKAGYN